MCERMTSNNVQNHFNSIQFLTCSNVFKKILDVNFPKDFGDFQTFLFCSLKTFAAPVISSLNSQKCLYALFGHIDIFTYLER